MVEVLDSHVVVEDLSLPIGAGRGDSLCLTVDVEH